MQITCVECHMPRIMESAWGEAEKFTSDLRSHLMVINPTQLEQFTKVTGEDGKEVEVAISQVGLNFACRHCHGGGYGTPKTDEELTNMAIGYHDRAEPTPQSTLPPSMSTPEPTPTQSP
jgi:hypothetical protein